CLQQLRACRARIRRGWRTTHVRAVRRAIAGQPAAGTVDPRARRCRDTGRGGAAGFAGGEGLSNRGAAGGGAPGHAATGDAVDLGVAALAAAKRRRATQAPPFILVAVTRSELVLHLHEAGAAVPVVLGGERRNVAVTGIHARGDARRILVQQVAYTDEHAPVRLLVAHG